MAHKSNIPTISITKDNTEEISDCQNDADFKSAYNTDIEDFDDEDGSRANMVKNLKKTMKKISPAVTDTEEYNDSCSEEEKSEIYPELMFSLQEFLDLGYTEEKTQISSDLTSKSDCMIKEGKFLSKLMVEDDPGCITDCENYDTSGDEIPDELMVNNNNNNNNNNTTGYTPEPEDVKISDKCSKEEKSGQDVVSDVEDEGAYALCTSADMNIDAGNVSEVEDVFLSGDEEIIQIEGSDSDRESETEYPVIDVTFVPEGKSQGRKGIPDKNKGLEIPSNVEEPLTDVEKLNSSDSDASTESDHPVIPTARASVVSLTDIEDLDLGEAADLLAEMQEIQDVNIPAPVREITVTREDESGIPVTNVMPLHEDLHLGIHNNFGDKGLTDTEDISCNEEDLPEISPHKEQSPNIIEVFVENANIQNCESVKVTNVRKIDHSENEPVTDVEEIFMAGTVRRRKNKSKSQNKPKSKYLDVRNYVEPSVTDVEEFDVSDFECTLKSATNDNESSPNLRETRSTSPELKTDIEYVTGEEDGDVSEDDQKSDISVPGQDIYFSTIRSVEALTQQGMPIERKLSPIPRIIKEESSGQNSQYPTDVEDVQLPSDVEENPLYETYSRADTISPGELQELLNDGGMSVVHVKCGKAFNVDEEKNHIKGMNDCTDAQTDVEYLDEEIGIDKRQSIKSKPEEEITAGTKVDFEGQPTLYEPEEGDIDYVRNEAANLIDSILEQSIMIVNAQQCNDYNSESEHYAITCDVNGIDMVKSPTIESLSGKSFDDNMSINDDNNIVNIPPLTTTTTEIVTTSSSVDKNDNNKNFVNDQNIVSTKPSDDKDYEKNRSEKNFDRIERKFERLSSQLDDLEESAVRFDTDFDNMLSKDDVSNLQSDFSKISWDESVSGATTAADVGLSTPDNDLQDLPTGGDASPEPKQEEQKK